MSDATTEPSAEEQLSKLLAEPTMTAARRERGAFDLAADAIDTKRIVLVGAGGFGQHIAQGLQAEGIEPLAFVDNAPAKWGTELLGVPVMSAEDAAGRYGDSAVFVVSVYSPGADRRYAVFHCQLSTLGCKAISWFVPLFWKYPARFLPYFLFDLPSRLLIEAFRIRAAFALLADEPTRLAFVRQLRLRLLGDADAVQAIDGVPQYFPGLFKVARDEYFVDGGAFVGDTVADFIKASDGRFSRIACFEADDSNFQKLTEAVNALDPYYRTKISLHSSALWSHNDKLSFSGTGDGAALVTDSGTVSVHGVALDNELPGEPITFIKMDIEGAEQAAIQGAAKTIKARQPILAVCVYHKPNDLWDVPLLIESIVPGYSFYMLPHNDQGLDTVCYGVPLSRRLA